MRHARVPLLSIIHSQHSGLQSNGSRDIVTHSTTKYMDGHGAAVGGAIVDSGKFDWMAHADKFPGLCTPDESYHGIRYARSSVREGAFITECT